MEFPLFISILIGLVSSYFWKDAAYVLHEILVICLSLLYHSCSLKSLEASYHIINMIPLECTSNCQKLNIFTHTCINVQFPCEDNCWLLLIQSMRWVYLYFYDSNFSFLSSFGLVCFFFFTINELYSHINKKKCFSFS